LLKRLILIRLQPQTSQSLPNGYVLEIAKGQFRYMLDASICS